MLAPDMHQMFFHFNVMSNLMCLVGITYDCP